MIVLGLTGNIASGKSVVAATLADLGARVLDADAVVHELLATDEAVRQAVVARFGPSVCAPEGGVDRHKLAALVFADPKALADLEAILHPAVGHAIKAWLATLRKEEEAAADPRLLVAVVDAVKLVESGLAEACDALWVITAPPSQQLARLMRERGMTEGEARARLAAQSPLQAKLARADAVIDNGGTLEQTRAQVERHFAALIARFSQAR